MAELPLSHQPVLHLLDVDEQVEHSLRSDATELRVTDRRLVVNGGVNIRLNIAFDELRRIQFDIEATRPATMVIVPHRADKFPEVLSIPRESLAEAALLLTFIAERMP